MRTIQRRRVELLPEEPPIAALDHAARGARELVSGGWRVRDCGVDVMPCSEYLGDLGATAAPAPR